MKNTNEMISSIQETFKKGGCELTEIQSAVLAGCLFIWFDAVRGDEQEKTLDLILMKTVVAKNEYIRNKPTSTRPTTIPVDDIFGIINSMRSK
jgi:hypothetical protein